MSVGLGGARHAALLRGLSHIGPTRVVVLDVGYSSLLLAVTPSTVVLGKPDGLCLIETGGEGDAAEHLLGYLLSALHVLAVGCLQAVC